MIGIALWTARLLSAGLICLLGLFAFAEGLPHPSSLMPIEILAFLAQGLMLIGLVAAWKWPGPGAILILLGYLFFWFVSGARSAFMPVFALFAVTGILFLIAWWGKGHQDVRLMLRLFAVAMLFAAGGWLRLQAGARVLEQQFATPPDWSGKWTGTAYASDSRVSRRPLPIALEVLPGPQFRGNIGEAVVLSGTVSRRLQGRLGYLQHAMGEPAHTVRLTLDRPPVATARGAVAEATLSLERRSATLAGAIHTLDRPEDLRDLHLVLYAAVK